MKRLSARRLIVLLCGSVLIGLGIAIFKTAVMGSDPHSAFMFAVAAKTGSTFSVCYYIACSIYIIAEILFARDLIHIGTACNWFLTGFFTDFFLSFLTRWFPDGTAFGVRLVILCVGFLIISLGVSMYQTADLGVGPYDALAIILDRKLPNVKYFWCRIFTDGLSALLAVLFGGVSAGLIGIGTLLSAFGLGPFISFFNRFSKKMVG